MIRLQDVPPSLESTHEFTDSHTSRQGVLTHADFFVHPVDIDLSMCECPRKEYNRFILVLAPFSEIDLHVVVNVDQLFSLVRKANFDALRREMLGDWILDDLQQCKRRIAGTDFKLVKKLDCDDQGVSNEIDKEKSKDWKSGIITECRAMKREYSRTNRSTDASGSGDRSQLVQNHQKQTKTVGTHP